MKEDGKGRGNERKGCTLCSRAPCKTVLEVNDNSDEGIPGRLTFES